MGNVLLNVPCGDGSALDLFGQELDMSVARHGFTAEEMPQWLCYGGMDIPDGYWDRDGEQLCVSGPEQDMTAVTHLFTDSEMPRWRGYNVTGLPEGCWNREGRALSIA